MSAYRRARRSRRRHSESGRPESGYTLIEMLISMTLLSIVVAAAFSALSVMQRGAVTTTNRFTAEGEAQTIADRITKDLRAAVTASATGAAFVSANVNDVTFYANLADPNGPTKLHAYLTLSGSNVYLFHEDATAPDTGGSPGNYTYSGTASTRIDGQYLDTSQPIFSYFDRDGVAIPTPITTLANLRSIDIVAINLRVRVNPSAPIVVFQTQVHIRNVDYNPNT